MDTWDLYHVTGVMRGDVTDVWVNPNPGSDTEPSRYAEDVVKTPDDSRRLQNGLNQQRNNSPVFSASGRRIPSALKRRGGTPPTPRKRVSFTFPDESARSVDSDEDRNDVEIVHLPKPVTSIPTLSMKDTASNQTTISGVLRLQNDVTAVTDRLPSIANSKENYDDDSDIAETSSPATFKSLRSKLRGLPPMRVRKSPPASNPLKICLHCKGSLVSHAELKKIIDSAIHYFKDAQVTCLQYDPLATWCGDPGAVNRWIISLSDSDACHYLTGTGVNIHGQHYDVVSYDDIRKEEYRVYKMKQEILQESKRKAPKTA